MIKGPLTGIRAIDLTRGIAGPWAAMIMGDLGAEVIKIEATAEGDIARTVAGPKHNGENFYFLAFNRNKKSVVLDLGTPSGRDALLDLVRVSDVVIENFRPGVMERRGLGYEDLKRVNPRLVMTSVSGYGHTGPYRDRGSYDAIAQGYSGMLGLTREAPGKPPVRSAPPTSDMAAGFFAAIGVLSGLVHRNATGEGLLLRTSLLGASVAMMCYHLSYYLLSGILPPPVGSGHMGLVPMGAYKARDDYVVIGTGWPRLARVIGADWMIDDPRFAAQEARIENRAEFDRILEEHLQKMNAAEWLEIFDMEDIPAGPVNTLDKVVQDPQVREQGLITEVEHTLGGKMRLTDNPIKSDVIRGEHASPPTVGQHTEEVLSGLLGYSPQRIAQIQSEREAHSQELELHLHKQR